MKKNRKANSDSLQFAIDLNGNDQILDSGKVRYFLLTIFFVFCRGYALTDAFFAGNNMKFSIVLAILCALCLDIGQV